MNENTGNGLKQKLLVLMASNMMIVVILGAALLMLPLMFLVPILFLDDDSDGGSGNNSSNENYGQSASDNLYYISGSEDEVESCENIFNPNLRIRMISCPHEWSESVAEKHLPGGAEKYDDDSYIAKDTVNLKDYLAGVIVSETSFGSNEEYLKLFYIMAQSFLFYRVAKGTYGFNDAGELLIRTGSDCFQNFKNEKFNNSYINGPSEHKEQYERIYNAVYDKILVDSDNTITAAHYKGKFQDKIREIANEKGLDYINLLKELPGIDHVDAPDYVTAQVKVCTKNNSTGQNSELNPIGANEKFVANARKYIGCDKYEIAEIFENPSIETGSWCAYFVSRIIDETPERGIPDGFTSPSVSRMMDQFIEAGRFCHSKYWEDESNEYKCAYGPQTGDIIFFAKSSCNYTGDGKLPDKTDTCYRHIGIVSKVEESNIYYIHGNTSGTKPISEDDNPICSSKEDGKYNGVAESTEKIDNEYIIGYGR